VAGSSQHGDNLLFSLKEAEFLEQKSVISIYKEGISVNVICVHHCRWTTVKCTKSLP
jgi:hypothetical protein